jgi:hypothetical protein
MRCAGSLDEGIRQACLVRVGVPRGDTLACRSRLTHQRADLGFSLSERAAVIAQVERSLRRGLAEPDAQQILELSGGQSGDEEVSRTLELAAEPGDGISALAVSAEQRDKLVKTGDRDERARHAAIYGESADAVAARNPEFFGR